jgi:hypothetical protein
MAYSRCDACGGRKTVMGLGTIFKDCIKCDGVGWLEPEASVDDGKVKAVVKVVKKKSKVVKRKVNKKVKDGNREDETGHRGITGDCVAPCE